MNNRFRLILINVLLILALLVAIETTSRITLSCIYNRNFDSSLISDNSYGHSSGLRANAGGMVWGKPFHTNAFGARKGARPYNSTKKNWLYIGDSVTEGVGVDDTATFSSICAAAFPQYNILNYSLIGYSTADYLRVLETVLSRDSAVELVTLFYCLNDVYGATAAKDLPAIARPGWKGKLNGWLQNRYATYKLIKLLFHQHSDRYLEYDLQFYQSDNPLFRQSMNNLYRCDSLCKSRNVFMQVVMLPYRGQLTDTSAAKRVPQQLVGRFCATAGIEFSDAAPELAHSGNVRSFYLFADEIHYSEEGHRALARFLSE